MSIYVKEKNHMAMLISIFSRHGIFTRLINVPAISKKPLGVMLND